VEKEKFKRIHHELKRKKDARSHVNMEAKGEMSCKKKTCKAGGWDKNNPWVTPQRGAAPRVRSLAQESYDTKRG